MVFNYLLTVSLLCKNVTYSLIPPTVWSVGGMSDFYVLMVEFELVFYYFKSFMCGVLFVHFLSSKPYRKDL